MCKVMEGTMVRGTEVLWELQGGEGGRGRGHSRVEAKEVHGSQTMKDHVCPAEDLSFMLVTKMKAWNML